MRAGFTVLLYPLPYYVRLLLVAVLPLTLLEVSVMNKITDLYIVVGGEVMDDMCVQKVTIEQLEKYTVYKISTVLTQVGMIGMLMKQNIYCWNKVNDGWVKLANGTPEAEQARKAAKQEAEQETAKQEQKEEPCNCFLCTLSRKYSDALKAGFKEELKEGTKARMPELEPAKLVQRVYATGRPIATCEYLEREGLKVVREGEVTYEGGKSQVVLWVQGTEEQHERVGVNINENMVYPGDEE